MKRKIILNLAMSLDGFIADKDGGFDWIAGDGDKALDTDDKFNFEGFLKSVDAIVMGRKAFEDCPPEGMEMYKDQKILVATSKGLQTELKNVEFTQEDIVKKVLALKEQEGKDIWIFGGGQLADAFVKADIIDEYIIGIIPMILGSGRSLFLDNNPSMKLHLDECTSQEGIIILRYSKRK